jgi:Uma2 family endonuclease
MATVESARMTVEEFLALPDDGVDRMLINGEVRELGPTLRDPAHATTAANVSFLLESWRRDRPKPRGFVGAGQVNVRLSARTMVGLDLAYVSPELAAATPKSNTYFDGVPTLAVEILPPSDKQEDIEDKITTYLDAGVPLVWIIQPRFRTVTVYRPDAVPRLFTIEDDITAEPHLPGFRAAVAEMFED